MMYRFNRPNFGSSAVKPDEIQSQIDALKTALAANTAADADHIAAASELLTGIQEDLATLQEFTGTNTDVATVTASGVEVDDTLNITNIQGDPITLTAIADEDTPAAGEFCVGEDAEECLNNIAETLENYEGYSCSVATLDMNGDPMTPKLTIQGTGFIIVTAEEHFTIENHVQVALLSSLSERVVFLIATFVQATFLIGSPEDAPSATGSLYARIADLYATKADKEV